MSMTNAQIVKKLRQHDNDILSIYEVLTEIRGTVDGHTTTLDQHTATLEEHTAILDRHTATLEHHTAILDQHTGLLHEILRRLPEAS